MLIGAKAVAKLHSVGQCESSTHVSTVLSLGSTAFCRALGKSSECGNVKNRRVEWSSVVLMVVALVKNHECF